MADKVKISKGTTEDITRQVLLVGLTDIMFDRYPGDNKTKLEPFQKMYLYPTGEGLFSIYLPALNILSFLSAENTTSAPKRLRDNRTYKKVTNACRSFVSISPMRIPFLRNNKPILFKRFEGDTDPLSGVYLHHSVARLKDGVPNPKERPVLPISWELQFEITITKNSEIQEQELQNLMQEGGRTLGLGTFRGVFGKFKVAKWD